MFVRDFVARITGFRGKFLLLYGPPVLDERQIRFAGKRLSANLSEQMLANVNLHGDQRGLITLKGESLALRTALFQEAWETLDGIVLSNLLGAEGDTVQLAEMPRLVPALVNELGIDRVVLFPSFARSPLGTPAKRAETLDELAKLEAAYPEENEVLTIARWTLPAEFCAANNF
jgi:hypothetical protein